MEIDNLLNFYNTLFSIEIAIFGIISAVILVFVQLIYSNYSYRSINHILTNKWLILYFVFSTIDLFITSFGSYLLSLPSHDLIPYIYFASNIIIVNQFYALACLLLIFFSIIFFIILIIKNITYLQPHRAIFLLSNSIKADQIKFFLWKKYKLEPPYDLRFNFARYILDDMKKPKESEKSRQARLKRKEKQANEELKRVEIEIGKIQKKVTNTEDPLLPIRDMMIQFIKKSDLSSLEEASELLINVSENFLKTPIETSNKWKPENILPLNYIKHIIELLNTVLEVADKEDLDSAKAIVLNVSHQISIQLFEQKRFDELDKIEEHWQWIADKSIGKSSIIFQNIIGYYGEIGKKLFQLLKNKNSSTSENLERTLENLFRYIAWLGERLLIKLPLEESPIFRNYEYNTEYDTYYNCLLSFSDDYNRDQPNMYPLIYFDALFVVLSKLVKIYKNDKNSQLDQNIFSIAYSFSSFAENAIKVDNSTGAALAVTRVKEAYEELKREGLDKEANDIIKLLIRIGIMAACNQNLKRVEFIGKPLDQWIIDTLANAHEDIASEVLEIYIKTMEGDHDLRWNFITQLGMRMGSNFGLMFDASTGELYADDDPRRR